MTWKNSRIQAYKKLIRKLLINIFDLINYYAEEVVGLETPEDNQSYCFEDSNMKFDSNFQCLALPLTPGSMSHLSEDVHSSNPVEYYCDLLNALQWVQPRVAAREVMCRVPFVNFHNLLIPTVTLKQLRRTQAPEAIKKNARA